MRVAGVKVGKVESLALEHGAVTVQFRVKDAFVGDQSEAAIKIETVLGAKYLALVPARRARSSNPDTMIPQSPHRVALRRRPGLRRPVHDRSSRSTPRQLASSFEVLSQTFADTPAEVRTSLQGLSRLSDTISSRDAQLQHAARRRRAR